MESGALGATEQRIYTMQTTKRTFSKGGLFGLIFLTAVSLARLGMAADGGSSSGHWAKRKQMHACLVAAGVPVPQHKSANNSSLTPEQIQAKREARREKFQSMSSEERQAFFAKVKAKRAAFYNSLTAAQQQAVQACKASVFGSSQNQ